LPSGCLCTLKLHLENWIANVKSRTSNELSSYSVILRETQG